MELFDDLRKLQPPVLQFGNGVFKFAQLLGEPGNADVLGLVMLSEFAM
ncbi:MAG: hypothetical protein QOJ61_3363, partial [Mycobacterium sp.]|nr:hypothetical protein [Mycobacterium sp.]